MAGQVFPTRRYRQTEGGLEVRRVVSPDALEALGPGWADTPAAFDEPAHDETATPPPAVAAKPKGKNGKGKAFTADEPASHEPAGDETGAF